MQKRWLVFISTTTIIKITEIAIFILCTSLVVFMMHTLYKDTRNDNTLLELEAYRQENERTRERNITRIESKINSVSENQDVYQINTNNRIDKLEQQFILVKEKQ